MDKERQRIINEAARIINTIDQIFIDTEYWNELHPTEDPIIADPDGQMAERRAELSKMLKTEAERGNYPSVVPIKARRRRYVSMLLEPAELPVSE